MSSTVPPSVLVRRRVSAVALAIALTSLPVAAHAWGQFDFSRQNAFSFGVAFGNLGI